MYRAGWLWSIAVIATACGANSPVGKGGSAGVGGAVGVATGAGKGGSAGSGASAGSGGSAGGAAVGAAGGLAAVSGGAGGMATMLHRPVATACPTDRSAPRCDHAAAGASPPNGGNCTRDADCKSGQNGRCVRSSPNDGFCDVCSYDECFVDADCSGGGPCDCRSSPVAAANVCSAGNCRVDADCGVGGYCSPSRPRCPYPGVETAAVGYFCRTSRDTCVEDDDCKASLVNRQCRYDGAAGLWRCIDDPGCPA